MRTSPSNPGATMSTIRRTFGVLAALLLAAGLTAAPASASPDITITFVRHGESEGNISGAIDTSVPGPSLTPKGEQQAKEDAAELSYIPHDGVNASSMIRTQQTAQPLADQLGLPIAVMPGLGRSRPATRGSIGNGGIRRVLPANAAVAGGQPLRTHTRFDRRRRVRRAVRRGRGRHLPGAASSGRSRTRTARPSRCGR